jgi:hypothetical protein
LPFCSRCTRVIVDAANDIITSAKHNGYLSKRICKRFDYFDDEKKDRHSADNPKLIYSQLYAGQIPWFIQNNVEAIAKEVKGQFSVLIISPYKMQSRLIVNALRDKGLKNIQHNDNIHAEEPTLFDGLQLLLKNRNCNLGWRIIAKLLLGKDARWAQL